jgi:hypothetical protein
VDPDVEALYGLTLDEFTKARDALARARTKEQGKEAGAAVKAVRKPSVVAWALNQLARQRPEEVEALLEAGGRVRRAQTATLEGGDPDELREATRAEATEVQALAAKARSILAETGRGGSPAHEERLATTLRAAAVDPQAGDLLRRGTLTTELSPAGFGFGVREGADDALPSLSLTSSRSARRSERKQTGEAEATRKEQEPAERERRREQERERRAAQDTAARLEREAETAEKRALEARQAADAAAKRVEELAQE